MQTTRKIVPVEDWPPRDKELWLVGTQPSTILDEGGVAWQWRAETIKLNAISYGRSVTWLGEAGHLDRASGPEDRWTPALLSEYIRALQTDYRAATVYHRVVGLERCLTVLAPNMDRRFIHLAVRKLPKGIDPSRKRARIRETAALVDLGISLMRRADECDTRYIGNIASQFRNGLQIALLALRPLRAKNFTMMDLVSHLVRRGNQWWLHFTDEETKNRRPIDVPFPEDLVVWLERYLEVYRPRLAGVRYTGHHVWVSYMYRPQDQSTIRKRLILETERAFGVGLSPHLFRDSLATSLAINDPEVVGIAHAMLGNALATTQRHYNLARSLEASRSLNMAIESLRDRSRGARSA